MKKLVGLFFASLFGAIALIATVNAQAPSLSGVATNIEVSDSAAVTGDILSISGDNFRRSEVAYDDKIYGVIAAAPVLSIEPKSDTTKAVVSSGSTQVRVNNANGAIVAGDFITSSTNPGVGQKVTESGYVLGKALASYDSSEPGLVAVEVQIGLHQLDAGSGARGFTGLINDPDRLRLILAAILALVVLVGGVIAFARLVNTGVTAIGRNPLARATIMRGMFVSGSVVVAIMVVGIGAAIAVVMLGR